MLLAKLAVLAKISCPVADKQPSEVSDLKPTSEE
jgi:hypothetical protein